jgi:HK97 family phage prohead protease
MDFTLKNNGVGMFAEKFFQTMMGQKISDFSEAQITQWQKANPEVNIDPARIKVFRASTEAVDRAGDVILQDGWDLTNYKTNPVFLMFHDTHSMPVGITLDASVTTYEGIKGLYLTVLFPTEDISKDSEIAFKAVNTGLMTAVSVGFAIQEYEWIDSPAKAAQYNMPIGGMLFKKQELTECSLVAVPCNQEAVAVKSAVPDRIIKFYGQSPAIVETFPKEVPTAHKKALVDNTDLTATNPKDPDGDGDNDSGNGDDNDGDENELNTGRQNEPEVATSQNPAGKVPLVNMPMSMEASLSEAELFFKELSDQFGSKIKEKNIIELLTS